MTTQSHTEKGVIVRPFSFSTLIQGVLLGFTFGVLFCVVGWLTQPEFSLVDRFKESLWYFSLLGALIHTVAIRYNSYEGFWHLHRYFFDTKS